MASYKVPQDVEADDKLIGPFSFRQFIYLIAVAMGGLLAWGLAQIFIGLAILPLPIMIFFGALALPLRKDQPMEIYMAALVSFYLKPHKRMWDPEGVETLIEISAPKTVEINRTNGLSQNEAEQRLSYLANIVDTGGWAIRGAAGAPAPSTSVNNDIFLEAQGAEDVLDTNTSVAHSFDQMMNQRTEQMHEAARARMTQATVAPASAPAPAATNAVPAADDSAADPNLQFNPYPTFHQTVIQPLNDTAHQAKSDITASPSKPKTAPKEPKHEETGPTTSDPALAAGIMNLANNPDLSIETIAHEAKRLHDKADESEEVVISLR